MPFFLSAGFRSGISSNCRWSEAPTSRRFASNTSLALRIVTAPPDSTGRGCTQAGPLFRETRRTRKGGVVARYPSGTDLFRGGSDVHGSTGVVSVREMSARPRRLPLQLKYIELFYEDIQDPDPQKRNASISLLAAMQPGVAEMVARAVAADPTATADVKRQVSDTLVAARRFGPLNAYRIVIYHDRSTTARAEQVKRHLVAAGFSGRIELDARASTFLPDATAYGYHVRYDDGFENEAAEHLVNLLREVYPSSTIRMVKAEPPKGRSDGTLTVFLFDRS